MSTPFTTTSIASEATNSQVIFIVKLLGERNWQTSGADDKAVARAAALNLVLAWATRPMAESTPPSVSRLIGNTVGARISTYGERANVILEYLHNGGENRQASYPTVYKPFTKAGASALIDWLTTCPKREVAVENREVDLPDVPAGHYALPTTSDTDNDIAFYQVDRPTEGRWAGRVFVKLVLGGGQEERLSYAVQRTVLERIAENIEEAAARYGHELGRCGFCNRSLTNKASRERGIGPDCAAKYI